MASCDEALPNNEVVKAMDAIDDGFDFDDGSKNGIILQNALAKNSHEEEFKRFCQEKKSNLSILHAYPIVKMTFLRYNTLLRSSASVERMFNLATMWNTPRFNRLTDEHFEQRVLLKANKLFQ